MIHLRFRRLQILNNRLAETYILVCCMKHFLLLLHGLNFNCYMRDYNMWVHIYRTFIHKPFGHVFVRYLMTDSSLQMYSSFKVIKRLNLQITCMSFMFTCEYVLFQLIFQTFQGMLSVWSQRTDASSLKNEVVVVFFTSIPMLSLVICSNYPHSLPSFSWISVSWYVAGLDSCPYQWKWWNVSYYVVASC